ncbi:MAG: dolichyl-phosphate beta-glucosyltransferase [Acidimicrobiales bacterium]|jgi:dolichyl-phosphate beta-glucosyltransferase
MRQRLTIIVPAFNEASRLPSGVERFRAAMADGAVDAQDTEVLVVDDGSSDATAEVARGLLAPLPHHRVISLPANGGKGAAVRTGVALARSPYVAYMDADMAIDPRAVPELMHALTTSEVAIGSRALVHSMVDGTYAVRAAMGRIFNRLVTTGTGLGLKDTQCGFKAFHTSAARLLFHLVRIDRFAFDVEILARARRLGLRTTEVPVQWKNVPGSTIHPLYDSVSMLADVYRSRLGLLATPPVPAVVIRQASAGSGATRLIEQVAPVVAATLDGMPVPLIADGASTTVLLPLVDPAGVAMVFSALRAECSPAHVTRREMSIGTLTALGPLTGRLTPGSTEMG